MSTVLKNRGGQYYHCADTPRPYKTLKLSKNSLGEFVAGIMSHNGEIIRLWNMFGTVPRSCVVAVVAITPEDKEKFERETGFLLQVPTEAKLN